MRKERLKSALFRARTLYRRGDIQRAIAELESALSEWKGFQRNKVEDALWYQAIAVLSTYVLSSSNNQTVVVL